MTREASAAAVASPAKAWLNSKGCLPGLTPLQKPRRNLTTSDLARLRATAEEVMRLNDGNVKRAAPKLARGLLARKHFQVDNDSRFRKKGLGPSSFVALHTGTRRVGVGRFRFGRETARPP